MRASARCLRRAAAAVDRSSAEYREAASALRNEMLATRRRVRASPTLRPEDVAVPPPVQRAVEGLVAAARDSVSVTQLRSVARRGELARAPEAQHRMLKRFKAPSNAPVLPPPDYSQTAEAVAYAATRTPGTRAAAVHALRELRRLRPDLAPTRLLDYGAGAGVATAAAVSVFDSPTEATLVEAADEMRRVGRAVLGVEPRMEQVEARWAPSIGLDDGEHDLVLCSYTLSEVARAAMVRPAEGAGTRRDERVRHAEALLRAAVGDLWARTAGGGHMVVIEDGTAAGFETVLLARSALLAAGGRVVAPCLHSGRCALEGGVTRHRLCRFVQRLNRPLFLRVAKPHHDGFEDEYFSYVVVEKPRPSGQQQEQGDEAPSPEQQQGWGRLVRSPLLRAKHVVLDACLRDGKLERYTITKNNSEPGMYNVARKARWGDVWPAAPKGNPQSVHF